MNSLFYPEAKEVVANLDQHLEDLRGLMEELKELARSADSISAHIAHDAILAFHDAIESAVDNMDEAADQIINELKF